MTDAVEGDADRATATLRTAHPRPGVVAAALAPDNTPQIDTRLDDGRVTTVVRREDVAGLRATVQDYLRNLDAADRTVRAALAAVDADVDVGDADADVGDADDADADDSPDADDAGGQHRQADTDTDTDSPINEDTQTHDNE